MSEVQTAAPPGIRIGVDVGGTFTDAVLTDGSAIWTAKSPTTANFTDGVLAACELAAKRAGKSLAEARLPQTMSARVMAIRRPGKSGEENILPSGETVLLAGDSLLLLGPTTSLDALAAGTLEPDEALAHRGID